MDDENLKWRLSEVLGDDWKNLSPADKKAVFARVKKDEDKDFADAVKSLRNIMSRTREKSVLQMGVCLGILGGMAATVIDRLFSKFGVFYDIAVCILFAGGIWFVNYLHRCYVSDVVKSTKLLKRIVGTDEIK